MCAGVRAQEAGLPLWRIEIQGQALPGPSADYTATLEAIQPHTTAASANMRPDNSFEFHGVGFGDYWITVTDPRGATIYRGFVTAHAGGAQTIIYAPLDDGSKQQAPGGPVSVAELRHPPSHKAISAMLESRKLTAKGRYSEAAAQIEKATRLAPEWPQAHSNLAAEYIRMGRFEDGIAEAQIAIGLSRPNPIDLGNMSYAEYRLDRRPAAIDSARAGLALDPQSPTLHYLLGVYLAMDRRTLPESISHLEAAAKTLPGARASLEQVRSALR
jgi:tetratricopeptide (TPR) repeat protein